jgi:hypothetical protein
LTETSATDSLVFRHSPLRRRLVTGVGLALCLAAIGIVAQGGDLLTPGITCMAIGIGCIAIGVMLGGHVSVDEIGITRVGPLGGRRTIAWSDVGATRTGVGGSLRLEDRRDATHLTIPSQLENFTALVSLIAQRRHDRSVAPATTFRAVYGIRLMIMVSAIAVVLVPTVALGMSPRDATFYTIEIVLVAAWILAMTVTATRLDMDDDALVLRYVFRERRIPRGDLTGIEWRSVTHKGVTRAYIAVLRDTGAAVRLDDFGAQPELAAALERWIGRSAHDGIVASLP